MDGDERIARIQLARTPGIGPLTYSKLISTYKSGVAALEALPDRIRATGHRAVKLYTRSQAQREIEQTERHGAKILLSSDPDYPTLLREMAPAPPIITVLGNTELTKSRCVAMVGARNASAAGMKLARTMAHDLGQAGIVVVSGLARGVDTAAHNGALESGTIAVIAGGIDNIYPAQNTELRHRIAETGLIISESAFGHEPRAKDFPRRNRLITGLSLGVVVVEAAQRSGSLISARCAADQGRDVMAVPGSPLDPRTRGSNGLIKSGATLVELADDVLEVISPYTHNQQPRLLESENLDDYDDDLEEFNTAESRTVILNALSPTPTSIADISIATKLPIRVCMTALVELELSGLARSLPGGMVQRSV